MYQNKLLRKLLLTLFISTLINGLFAQGVAINVNKLKPDTSAMLDVSSPKGGVLIPRLALQSITDVTTIPEPAHSLMVYNTNTDVNKFSLGEGYYVNQGEFDKANWIKLLNSEDNLPNIWFLNGNDNITDENFIGTKTGQDVIFKQNSTEAFRITKGAVLLAGNYPADIPDVVPVSGPGTRLMWMPAREAFRAGSVVDTEWDDPNIGIGSFATGAETIASGQHSIAMGFGSTAIAGNAIALGAGANANKLHSVAIGSVAVADGTSAVAIGAGNQALKIYSLALGNNAKANGNSSCSIGEGTLANAVGSMAVGRYNKNTAANGVLPMPMDKIFMVGNGTGNSDQNRNDAFYVLRNGNATLSGMLTQNSDIRFKEKIEPLKNVLNNINHIQPIAYYFKNKQSHSGNKQIGFSAQEIQQQFPELVSKDENDYLSVSYANMTAVAIQAIKEQQELIKKLTTENAEIKNRLEQLEKYILNK